MPIARRLLTINHRAGRSPPYPVDVIVVHVTEGDAASVTSWFNNPQAEVSAHYMVRKDGGVVQFVDEDDQAWHAGRTDRPTAAIVKERTPANVNGYSIGIEHEGDGKHELTDAQRAASVDLIRDICQRRNIPIDRRHIIGHHEVFFPKTCPGAIDVDRLVAEAAAAHVLGIAAPAPSALPAAPRVVWSDYAKDYLIVTRVESDTAWWYVSLTAIRGGLPASKAQTALSIMRIVPVVTGSSS